MLLAVLRAVLRAVGARVGAHLGVGVLRTLGGGRSLRRRRRYLQEVQGSGRREA